MRDTLENAAEPLRIGLFVSDFPILSETFVATLAESLLLDGHDLQIIARDRAARDTGPMHDYVADAGLMDRLSRSDETGGRLAIRSMLGLARAQPRKTPTLAALWALDRVVPRRTMAVTRHLSALRPFDIIHAQFATLGETAQRHRDYGTLRTRALVVHLRGYDITSHVQEHGPGVYDRVFSSAELFVANCEYFRQVAIGLGCPAERSVVIGSPIDTSVFVPPARSRPVYDGTRPLRLAAVGRLVEKKGFGDAIAALSHLDANGVEAELDILGGGPLLDELRGQAEAAGLGARVTLHGPSTRSEILAALHAADIGLAPSVTASAGDQDAPVNTLKEQMATGLPVVATRHGGIPELVIDGENGRLVPERDPPALAAAIADLAGKPALWPELGRKGREKVIENYDREVILQRQLEAYRQALAVAETQGAR